ncbi:MAG: hypothetical protein V3U30_03735 [Thermoplasmata archaeon]
MNTLEKAIALAVKALVVGGLRQAAAEPERPRLALTVGQREELVRRVTAQFKALGEREGPP